MGIANEHSMAKIDRGLSDVVQVGECNKRPSSRQVAVVEVDEWQNLFLDMPTNSSSGICRPLLAPIGSLLPVRRRRFDPVHLGFVAHWIRPANCFWSACAPWT